ncbi:MAG: hypothetical protein F9K38_03985 [Pseudorhodoplanes sp.]|nr:MAG: hypothetical protein F9K38_03985 [Pseudorhodoplanes sp.]
MASKGRVVSGRQPGRRRMKDTVFETADDNVRSLYQLLNIIDGKASALLSFNALLLAAISIWLGYVPQNYLHLFLDLAFLALLASCFLLLRIIWLHWSRPKETAKLDVLRKVRTARYRFSWVLSMIAVVVVSAVSVVHTVGTGLKAFGHCQSGPCAHFFGPEVFGNLDHGR